MYKFAKFIRWVLLKTPLSVCFLLGVFIGRLTFCNGKRRRTAFKNIKMAYPKKAAREIKKILRESFNNFGISIIATLISPRIFKYVKMIGVDVVDPQGAIMLCIHEGNWEIYNALFAKTHNQTVLVNEQKQKGLDRLLNEIRKESGVYISTSLKKLMECLKKGYFIGLVADHGAEDNALIVEFFSHLVPTPRGAVYLAKRFNKKIYPTFGYRTKGFSLVVDIGAPVEPKGEDEEILGKINKIYEDHLSRHPGQYLWSYKRFKEKKDLNLLILNDGKAGHLKQSQALAAIFSEENSLTRSEIVDLRYKNKFAKGLAYLCALFSGRHCCGCGACFWRLLSPQTKKNLEQIYADIVISTGSYAAPINKLFSSYLGAKSVNILKANLPLRLFDLNIVPQHDRVVADNVATIKGALSQGYNLEEKAKRCKNFFNLSEDKKISFFIGGPLKDERKFMDNLSMFMDRLKKFAEDKDYRLLLSTSRRTPKIIEDYLEKELDNFKNCEVTIYANRENYDFVFAGFIGLSEITFASSESISMISEATAFGKPSVAVLLEEADDKWAMFLESMKEEINILKPPYDLKTITPKTPSVYEENKKAVKEAIKKLL